ncbi:caspase domain-containing protein [Mycena polygramma]|nr:caspase domain-containing protein [Mycena polygramma]
MMWDLAGGGHASTQSVAMPVPSLLSVPQRDHRARPSSVPGPPTPGWTVSRAGTPVPPMLAVPASFLNSDPGPYQYEPVPRGVHWSASAQAPAHHHHASPARHHHHHHHATVVQLPVSAPRPLVQQQQHHHQAPFMPAISPHFQYSKCTGRRRALCIGINYRGQRHELRGCINDAKHVFSFLVRHAGYKAEDIVVLTDDSPHARSQPTRQNIIDAMRWLVRDARPHDALFFHYSGHGGQTPDRDGDEVDKQSAAKAPPSPLSSSLIVFRSRTDL